MPLELSSIKLPYAVTVSSSTHYMYSTTVLCRHVWIYAIEPRMLYFPCVPCMHIEVTTETYTDI